MNGVGRHAVLRAQPRPPVPMRPGVTRLGLTTIAAAAVAMGAIIAAVAVQHGPASVVTTTARTEVAAAPVQLVQPVVTANAVPAIHRLTPVPPQPAPVSLALTAADYRDCPATTTACVDLARHITWMQAGGTVTFGPVQMEPGKPGSAHQTPRGTFQVSWKAGPDYVSNIYHEAMPWPTFFATGGIAFHGGSLTAWSHGCVHLTVANAHYYNEHLPIGAQVTVF